jgi:hypothetical protein
MSSNMAGTSRSETAKLLIGTLHDPTMGNDSEMRGFVM